jgi:hypothetical protein
MGFTAYFDKYSVQNKIEKRIFINQTGIYEQLITQLVQQNLDRESFYVGERSS